MSEDIKNGLIIDDYGVKYWFKDDLQHRECGPAVDCPNGDTWWYKNGNLHRIGGHTIELSNGYKQWWLYGKQHTEREYNRLVSNLPLLYWNRFKWGMWI